MQQYNYLVQTILNQGEYRSDRTGVGTYAIFNYNMRFDLRERFPLVQSKETRWKTAFLEMLWFLRGETDTSWLNAQGCKLWDAWADGNGNLGPIYGVQWRSWATGHPPIDQVKNLIRGLRENPTGRRHIVTAWNVGELEDMALPPCHWAHQCYVSNSGDLDMTLFMRSSDVALGLPFNIAQYALLQHLYGRAAGLKPRFLHVHLGDAHLYANHIGAMHNVVNLPNMWDGAELRIKTDNVDIDCYKIEDFEVTNYQSHPFVKLEVAV